MKDQQDDYVPWIEKSGGFAKDMTLRDAVALQVLPGLLLNSEFTPEEDLEIAFKMADKFLARRDK